MSENNLILNPDALELKKFIDWESVTIIPAWKAAQVPYFLLSAEVSEPPPVGTTGADAESLLEPRKDWEKI